MSNNKITQIPLADVVADNDFNCREFITPFDVRELAESIKQKGLIQPVVVRNVEGAYHLVAGFRRYNACRLLKLATIDAIIRTDLTELDAATINLTENIERKNLNLLEEARAVKRLLDQGYDAEDVGRKLSKSANWIQTRLSVLELPERLREEVALGVLNLKQVDYLLSLPEDMQFHAVRKIKEKMEKAYDSKGLTRDLMGETKRQVSRTDKGTVKRAEELKRVREYIYELFGPSLEVVILAWAEGLTTYDMVEKELKDQCRIMEIPYSSIEEVANRKNIAPKAQNL